MTFGFHSESFIFCHPEPFASYHSDPEPFPFCHPERSEGSYDAQGKLREGEESNSGKNPSRGSGRRLEIFRRPDVSGLLRMTLLDILTMAALV